MLDDIAMNSKKKKSILPSKGNNCKIMQDELQRAFYISVNLGQQLLRALFEHWPKSHMYENQGKNMLCVS